MSFHCFDRELILKSTLPSQHVRETLGYSCTKAKTDQASLPPPLQSPQLALASPLHPIQQRLRHVRHSLGRRLEAIPILELLERDRLVELVDGENLVGVVVSFQLEAVVVELVVADAAILFEGRAVGRGVFHVRVADRWGAGAGGKDLADVVEAGVGRGAVEPDSLHAPFEPVLAEVVRFGSRDNLLHGELARGEDDVRLDVSKIQTRFLVSFLFWLFDRSNLGTDIGMFFSVSYTRASLARFRGAIELSSPVGLLDLRDRSVEAMFAEGFLF